MTDKTHLEESLNTMMSHVLRGDTKALENCEGFFVAPPVLRTSTDTSLHRWRQVWADKMCPIRSQDFPLAQSESPSLLGT